MKMLAAVVALHWLTWGVRIRTARSGGVTGNARVALTAFRGGRAGDEIVVELHDLANRRTEKLGLDRAL